jgi:hypothetical protein
MIGFAVASLGPVEFGEFGAAMAIVIVNNGDSNEGAGDCAKPNHCNKTPIGVPVQQTEGLTNTQKLEDFAGP